MINKKGTKEYVKEICTKKKEGDDGDNDGGSEPLRLPHASLLVCPSNLAFDFSLLLFIFSLLFQFLYVYAINP